MTSPDPRRRRSDRINELPRDRVEPLGGADAVEKTTYTAPSGSDPRDEPGTDPVATARVRSGPFGSLTWLALVLALVVLLIYGLGFLR